MTNTWILTTDRRIVNLVEAAATVSGTTTVIVVAPSAPVVGGVDTIIHVLTAESVPAEAYTGVVVRLLTDAKGDVILAANHPAERSFAGIAAAVLALPVVVGVTSVSAEGAEVTRYGRLTSGAVAFKGAVLILESGAAPGADDPVAQAHEGAPMDAVVVDTRPAGSGPADLATARRIISCGHGSKAGEDLGLARTLAEALGAEIAYSRPLAEGTTWLSKDRYVGVSGMYVAPDVYATLGISGQAQHASGMADSKVVVAVNNDANAPTFRISDYGIVGDIYDAMPALTAALS